MNTPIFKQLVVEARQNYLFFKTLNNSLEALLGPEWLSAKYQTLCWLERRTGKSIYE